MAPRLLEAFARDVPRAVVVQVGANDGVKLDPLRRHLLRRRWRAYLIEPVPYVYEVLAANTRHHRHVTAVNVAIGPVDGDLEFHHLPPTNDPTVPDWYDALGSFRRDVVLSHRHLIPDIEERVVTTLVPTLTFETFARLHGIDHLDLLHVDTEGYDLEILRSVDFGRLRPAIVLYERHHLTDPEREAAASLLRSHGYELRDEGLDTLAVRVPGGTAAEAGWVRAWASLRHTEPVA